METIERGQMTLVENGATLDELNGEMAEDRDRWNLSRLAYVDEDGVWYFADTTQRYTRSQDYLNKTLLEGKRSISGIETMDGQDVLVFSIPVNAVIDGHHMKALAGVYGVDEMLQLLSIDSFEGRRIRLHRQGRRFGGGASRGSNGHQRRVQYRVGFGEPERR